VVMTISQAGTGSGASGTAIRRIYEAMYGIKQDTSQIDPKKGLLPKPLTSLPRISPDGEVVAASYAGTPGLAGGGPAVSDAALFVPGNGPRTAGGPPGLPAALAPARTGRVLYGRRSRA